MTGSEDRFLIVNADDFGRSETVNAGVVEAFRRGILTSTSIVTTGTVLEPDRQHEPALPPSEIPSLVTGNGKLRARRKQFRKMAVDPLTREDVFREWDAQISKGAAGWRIQPYWSPDMTGR